MPDARPLIAADKADAIETWLEALEAAAANLRRVLDNVKAAQADLERNDPRCSRAALKFVVLDNLRSAQSGPMVRALASLGRLMYALADAEDATPLQMERHPDLDPCGELDSVALSMVESVRHVIEDHVGSSACICGLPTDGGRRSCDDLYGLLYDIRRDYPPADPAWLTDFVARWPDVWEWGDDGAGVPSTVTDFVRNVIRYDLALRVENHAVYVLDAKARQIGLPDLPPPAPPTRPQLLETLVLLDDGELRAVLAAVVDAQTTGNGWLAYHGRLASRPPRDALIVEPATVEGHIVKLAAIDDGVHLSCSCGWDHNLGFNADVPDAAVALAGHLTVVAPSAPL